MARLAGGGVLGAGAVLLWPRRARRRRQLWAASEGARSGAWGWAGPRQDMRVRAWGPRGGPVAWAGAARRGWGSRSRPEREESYIERERRSFTQETRGGARRAGETASDVRERQHGGCPRQAAREADARSRWKTLCWWKRQATGIYIFGSLLRGEKNRVRYLFVLTTTGLKILSLIPVVVTNRE